MVCRASALGDRHAPRWDRLQCPGMQEWVRPPPHGSQPHHGHPGEDPGILPHVLPPCSEALPHSPASCTRQPHSPSCSQGGFPWALDENEGTLPQTDPGASAAAGPLRCAWGCPRRGGSHRSSLPWESLVVPPKISSSCQRMNFLEKPWQPPESSAGMSGLCGQRGGIRDVGPWGGREHSKPPHPSRSPRAVTYLLALLIGGAGGALGVPGVQAGPLHVSLPHLCLIQQLFEAFQGRELPQLLHQLQRVQVAPLDIRAAPGETRGTGVMGDAETHARYHHSPLPPHPTYAAVPWNSGCKDAEEQHQSPAHPLPPPGAACGIPRALRSAAGPAPSQVACLILLGWDKAGGAGPTAWPRFVQAVRPITARGLTS